MPWEGEKACVISPLRILRMINNFMLFCVVSINTWLQSSWTRSKLLPPPNTLSAAAIVLAICKHIYHCDKCMIWHCTLSSQSRFNITSLYIIPYSFDPSSHFNAFWMAKASWPCLGCPAGWLLQLTLKPGTVSTWAVPPEKREHATGSSTNFVRVNYSQENCPLLVLRVDFRNIFQ